eukprot:TRINITY_DN21698_c0_g1_i1.p1 TRINITY_DN21698_c0_g1~~TRINITY_DN21698_c0_g1_i1.p1  ORF type:complete len:565 (+),score=123.13 TRINITY_DN21698_c0_g1_i1:72-1766(+)
MARRYDAVIFDIGGVIMQSPMDGFHRYEREKGLPHNYINVNIHRRTKTGGAWQRLERSEVGMPQFLRDFKAELEDPATLEGYVAWLRERRMPVPEQLPAAVTGIDTAELMRRMTAATSTPQWSLVIAAACCRAHGLKIAALTNNFKADGPSTSSFSGGVFSLFDTVVESALTGLRKPDPRIYHLACERLGVDPGRCVFLDDLGLNLRPARAMGMGTVRVSPGPGGARSAAAELGKLVGIPLDPMAPGGVTVRVPCGAGGGALACDLVGDPEGLPVLWLHGGGQTRHAWGGSVSALAARGCFCINVDLKGHGDSYWDPAGATEPSYRPTSVALDIDRLLEQLVLTQRRPVIVGASMGGLSSLLTRASRDGHLGASVLVDVTPTMRIQGVQRVLSFMIDKLDDGFASLEEAADAVARYQPHRKRARPSGDELNSLQKNLRRGKDGRWRWHWDPNLMRESRTTDFSAPPSPERVAYEEHLKDCVRRFTQHQPPTPLLLVRGQQTDLVGAEDVELLRSLAPHAETVDVRDAAHMVAGDSNSGFTAAVESFLAARFAGRFAPAPRTARL